VTEKEQNVTSQMVKAAPGDTITITVESEREAEAIRQMARWWVRLEGAKAVGAVVAVFIKWVAIFTAALSAIRLGLVEWIVEAAQR